jgi:hypothetical protein
MMKRAIVLSAFATLTLLALGSANQAQQKVRARDLFLAGKTETPAATPEQKVSAKSDKTITNTKLAGTPLGLRYSILKKSGNGEFVEVDPDTNFKSGDKIRLTVEANDTGYLYIVTRGSSGKWSLLFPNKEILGGNNVVEKGNRYEIPIGTTSFEFDDTPGVEKLFFLLSRQQEPDFDKLVQSLKQGSGEPAPAQASSGGGSVQVVSSLDDATINKNRSRVATRDLVFEKVSEENIGAKSEKAIYVVNKSASPDARVVVDISLNHR